MRHQLTYSHNQTIHQVQACLRFNTFLVRLATYLLSLLVARLEASH
jgi:hypothetical protein